MNPMTNTCIVGYLRVSKERQGRSGLGIEAQQASIAAFVAANNYQLAASFIEVETGKGFDALDRRPKLRAALERAKALNCPIIIAKLDRLSRNVAFISSLMESRVRFLIAAMPNAPTVMLHVYAAFAEEERRMIAQRTKEALAAAKARGTRLGSPTIGARSRARADANAERLRAFVQPLAIAGISASEIARRLNASKITTANGKGWHPVTVVRLLRRLETVIQ